MIKSFSSAKIVSSPEKKLPLSARIHAKLSTQSTASKTNRSNKQCTPSFRMSTASDDFNTPTKKQMKTKDIAIVHEVKLTRRLLIDSPKKAEKRDPILQNNGEKNVEPPRRHVSIEKYSKTPSKDELFVRAKKMGEFNYNINPPNQDPKPQGIKPFTILPSECRDERAKRIADNRLRAKSTEMRRCPITEGEDYFRKSTSKPVIQLLSHSQFINDKKFLLKSERGRSSNNPHLATTMTLGDEVEESLTDRPRSKTPQRPLTTIEQKMRGYAKGILEYENGPNYRDHKITEKCGTVKFSDLLKGLEVDRIFATRKKSVC